MNTADYRRMFPLLPTRLLAVFIVTAGLAQAQQQDLISFEPDAAGYLPDGSLAVDNLSINDQYRAQYGVSFGFDANGDLRIDPGTGFQLENTANSNGSWGYVSTLAPSSRYNSAASGFESQLGDWFLTNDRSIAGSDRLLITYDNPVNAASGEIWDIDGRKSGAAEQWRVEAFDQDGSLLASLESPLGTHYKNRGSLDSKPWLWSFDVGIDQQISTILMSPIGDAGNAPVAFNNFATASVTNELMSIDTPVTVATTVSAPEPPFWILFSAFGAIGLGFLARRKARHKPHQ